MKLSKTKKIILLTAGLALLTTSIVTPIVFLNKDEKSQDEKSQDENNKENDVDKDILAIKNILDAKTNNDLIITLSRSSNGNIIGKATNKNEIIKKLRILIDSSNTNGEANHSSLRGTSIDISMSRDATISTSFQNIIVSISKTGGTTLRTTKIFKVKKESTPNEDIRAIKEVLDAKTNRNLIITLPRSSNGNIIGKAANKNEIIKKLRILIDSSNTNGQANHSSLRGTSIDISMSRDATISTSFQNIIVSISKTGGTTLRTTKIFKVKKVSTPTEDIRAIRDILNNKTENDLIITLPSDSTGLIKDNKNEIIKKLRILIDPSNTNGKANHWSLRGVRISLEVDDVSVVSTSPKRFGIFINKYKGIGIISRRFQVRKA